MSFVSPRRLFKQNAEGHSSVSKARKFRPEECSRNTQPPHSPFLLSTDLLSYPYPLFPLSLARPRLLGRIIAGAGVQLSRPTSLRPRLRPRNISMTPPVCTLAATGCTNLIIQPKQLSDPTSSQVQEDPPTNTDEPSYPSPIFVCYQFRNANSLLNCPHMKPEQNAPPPTSHPPTVKYPFPP